MQWLQPALMHPKSYAGLRPAGVRFAGKDSSPVPLELRQWLVLVSSLASTLSSSLVRPIGQRHQRRHKPVATIVVSALHEQPEDASSQ